MSSEDPEVHWVQKWISIGDLLVLISSLIVAGIAWGSLSKDVSSLRDDVSMLMAREITPGAQAEIAAIRSTDLALQRQLDDLRVELRASRAEMMTVMQRIETKLDDHDKPRR